MPAQLSEDMVTKVFSWCDKNEIDCLYFLGDAADSNTIGLAEDNSFKFVDIRVTLEKEIQEIMAPQPGRFEAQIRPSLPADIPALIEIARISHRDTRFYYDSNFPAYQSDKLYTTWIEKSCNGYADIVLVADLFSKPSGYITCHRISRQQGKIGLIGVDVESRNNGLGFMLVSRALDWFSSIGVSQVEIVTQGRNIAAQRLYQRFGFLTSSVQLWYHLWFRRGGKE